MYALLPARARSRESPTSLQQRCGGSELGPAAGDGGQVPPEALRPGPAAAAGQPVQRCQVPGHTGWSGFPEERGPV